MDACGETSCERVSIRTARLNNLFLGRAAPGALDGRRLVSRDALLDTLLLLYHECGGEKLRRDDNVKHFLNKFHQTVRSIKNLQVNLSDFEIKKTIGRGHFGEVQVVREKQTGDVYAMKIIRKANALAQKNMAFFEEERDIMATATSPWLTSLQYAFQDISNLYLVMEFHPGGDLLGLLERFEGRLSEDMARFYLAEIILAIHALHSMGYVHRDIKPENVLLDRCGHLKLVDFGSAATISPEGKVTGKMPVGTADYIAPEVLASMEHEHRPATPYGLECDYWSLGIVAYEMLYGSTPFADKNVVVTYSNIMNYRNTLKFPNNPEASSDYKDLVAGLLSDGTQRLKYDRLVRHKFFIGIEWSNIANTVPPFVPHVTGQDDTSNFEEIDCAVHKPSGEEFQTKGDFSGRNLPFVGFTFVQPIEGSVSGDGCLECEKSTKGMSAVNAELEKKRNECRELQSKLRDFQFGSGDRAARSDRMAVQIEDQRSRIQELEDEAEALERKMISYRNQVGVLERRIALEQQGRAEMEQKALEMIGDMKQKWRRETEERVREKTRETEEWKRRWEEGKERMDKTDSQLEKEREERAVLQARLQEIQGKLSKSKDKRRSSLGNLQSRMDAALESAHQRAQELQVQLDQQLKTNAVTESLLRDLRNEVQERERRVRKSEQRRREEVEELERQSMVVIDGLERKSQGLQSRCRQLETQLEKEQREREQERSVREDMLKTQKDCQVLRSKLNEVQCELEQSQLTLEQQECSFVSKESQLEELIASLEEKVGEVEAEKAQLSTELEAVEAQKKENQCRITELEALIHRLESNVVRLEDREQGQSPAVTVAPSTVDPQVVLLQAQVEKMEGQLEKVRESLILEREKSKSLEQVVRTKEREISEAKLDVRMAQREAKLAEDQLKKGKEKEQILGQRLKESEEEMRRLQEEAGKFQEEGAHLQKEKAELQEEKSRLQEAMNEAREQLQDGLQVTSRWREESQKMEERAKELQAELDGLREELSAAQKDAREALKQKEKTQRKVEKVHAQAKDLEMNNSVLKETCTILDEQLKDLEQLVENSEEKESKLAEEKFALGKQVEELKEELRKAKQQINEEKSLRLFSEHKAKNIEVQLQASSESNSSQVTTLRGQLEEYKEMAEKLTQEVNELEKQVSDMQLEKTQLERNLGISTREASQVKEENSQNLTQVGRLRDSNFQLTQALEDLADKCKAYKNKISELEAVMKEMEAMHHQREVKMEATINQQSKLIDFLQDKTEAGKRKRQTLTDKLFGGRQKENSPPTPLGVHPRDLERLLEKERMHNRQLSQEVTRLRAQSAAKTSTVTPNAASPLTTSLQYNSQDISNNLAGQKENQERLEEEAKCTLMERGKELEKNDCNSLSLLKLKGKDSLDFNCALQIEEQVAVLGAEQGLYSLHREADSDSHYLVRISGVEKVHQMKKVEDLDIALLVAGSEQKLLQASLRAFSSAAKAASCSRPNLPTRPVEGLPACLLFTTHGDLLCAATSNKLCLLRWDSRSGNYNMQRSLATSQVYSSLVMTGRGSVLAGSLKLYELDLHYISMEEFLDAGDSSLTPFLSSSSSHPVMAVLDLSCSTDSVSESGKKSSSREFLVCFKEAGVFLDAFGTRSRAHDVIWRRRPLTFAYEKPYLFVFYSDSLEVIKLTSKSYTKEGKDRDSSCFPHSVVLELPNVHYLGPATKGSVYVTTRESSQVDVLQVDGHVVVKDEDGLSFCSFSSSEEVLNSKRAVPKEGMNSLDTTSVSTTSSINHTVNGSSTGISMSSADELDSAPQIPIADTGSEEEEEGGGSEFSFSGSVMQDLDSTSEDTLSMASDLSAASSSIVATQGQLFNRDRLIGSARSGSRRVRFT